MAYTDPNQIGEVTEVTGAAKIIRTDGSEETVQLGDPIYQGDIIETDGDGAVNLNFLDDSSFAVSEDARISIDEFVFDPSSESGDQDFSVIRGVFMYTSGLIGRENPDSVEIDTPVGSIGIRGTIIGGHINPEGDSQITVIEGAIVVRNDGGEQLLTNQYDTVTLNSMNAAPSEVRTLDVQKVANDYGSVKDVSASLFSSFQDQMQQEGPSNNLDLEPNNQDADMPAEEPAEDINDASAESDLNVTDNQPETLQDNLENRMEDLQEKRAEVKQEIREKIRAKNEIQRDQDLDQNNNEDLIDPTTIGNAANAPVLEFINGGSLDENSPANTLVGQVGLDGQLATGSGVTYFLTNNPGGLFTINSSNGVIRFTGAQAPNFENSANPGFSLGVQARRPDGSIIVEQPVEVDLADVLEIQSALEDKFSVSGPSGGIEGVIDINELGAFITEIKVNEESAGLEFDIADFSIIGPNASLMEVIEQNGDILLKLKDNVKIIEISPGNLQFEQGGNLVGSQFTQNSFQSINVRVTDQSDVADVGIDFSFGDVTHINGSTNLTVSTGQDIIFGDASDNVITILDDDFKFIKGGEGHDLIRLDGANGNSSNDYFDLTSTVTNIGANNSADLKSIEEFRFVDNLDSLKLNIADLKDLLKTSENDEIIVANGAVGAATGGAESSNEIRFYDGGYTKLTDHGFVKDANEVTENGENFHKFTHADLGTVLIETDIMGSANGGVI